MTSTEQLADAWRGSARQVEECIFWINKHLETIESSRYPRDVIRAKELLPWRLSIYLEAIRRVSEFEERMLAIGISFSREPV